MGELLYEWMDAEQAADALGEYLAEREPALQRLRATLTDHGIEPDALLDGTPESIAPVWEWITTQAEQLGIDPRHLGKDPTRPSWPTWARRGMLVDPHPPAATIALVDGFVTYLGQVLRTAVPQARWQTGHHRISDYPMHHRPVLAGADHEVFLPGLPLYSVYQSANGRDPMDGTEMLAHTHRTIAALRGEGPEAATTDEPLVTVASEVDCIDVGLRADIATEHPQLVDELVVALGDRDGVEEVHRYGPAALVVNLRSWDELQLRMWCTLWLQRHLPR
ncbi:hypothetical protein [Kocuria sp. CPCC 205263]|uniref:hypothetical protein n=1 Tax=Kocuria sp. CPCC 205263 TaxID=3073555 RepID=UPI0034D5E35D